MGGGGLIYFRGKIMRITDEELDALLEATSFRLAGTIVEDQPKGVALMRVYAKLAYERKRREERQLKLKVQNA